MTATLTAATTADAARAAMPAAPSGARVDVMWSLGVILVQWEGPDTPEALSEALEAAGAAAHQAHRAGYRVLGQEVTRRGPVSAMPAVVSAVIALDVPHR